jgi:hypothetical protein
MVLGKLDITHRRLILDLYRSPCMQINSKWIKYFHVTPETLKLLEKTLPDIGIGNNF